MAAAKTEAAQIAAAIAKFDPGVARVIREVRAALRSRFPTAYEVVYDNYNFFVIGYSATERPSHCVDSLAANAHGVGLSFYRGADVSDPHSMLEGSGKQNRFVRLREGVRTLGRPEIAALIDSAEERAPMAMRQHGRIVTIVRSVSANQRPRRSS